MSFTSSWVLCNARILDASKSQASCLFPRSYWRGCRHEQLAPMLFVHLSEFLAALGSQLYFSTSFSFIEGRNILGATSGVVYFTESPNFALHYFFKMYSATILDQRKEDHPFFRTSVLAHMIKFVRRNTVIELKAVTSTLHGQLVYFVVSFMTAWPIPGPLITHHFCKKITRRN